jgi:hypothetical protein
VYLYSFLTTALEGGEGQHHAPAALYPQERPGTHCTGGWVDPRVGLGRCGLSRLHRDSIPGPFSPEPVAISTELPCPKLGMGGLYIMLLSEHKFLNYRFGERHTCC